MKAVHLFTGLFTFFLSTLASSADDFSSWAKSRNISINTTSGGAAVTGNVRGFPLLVRLDREAFDFSQARSDGGDIRFSKSDGTTALSYHIERWDSAAGLADVWVRIDTVYGNNSSQSFKMYWGKPSATTTASGAGVYRVSGDFEGAWHLNEAGTGTRFSQTGRPWNGVTVNYDGDEKAEGVAGRSDNLDATNDKIIVGDIDMTTGITISAWVNPLSFPPWGRILDKAYAPCLLPWAIYTLYLDAEIAGRVMMSVAIGTNNYSIRSTTSIPMGQWSHVAGTWDGDTVRIFVNGTLESKMAAVGTLATNDVNVNIGSNSCFEDQRFHGKLDEVQLSRAARSPDWMKLSYQTQKQGSKVVAVGKALSAWNHSETLTLNTTATGADISGTVTQFPLLVRLTGADFDFSQAKSGGADLRFSKPGGELLPYHIERWDSAGKNAAVWVKLDTVHGNNATQSIRMHWGNALAASEGSGPSVFTAGNGYRGVWHLNEGGTGTRFDKGPEGRHGMPLNFEGDEGRIGIIAGADSLDATNDRIDVGDLDLSSEATLSAWVNMSTFPAHGRIIGKAYPGCGYPWTLYGLLLDGSSSGKVLMTVATGDIGHYAISNVLLPVKQWAHVVGTYDGANIKIYINGKLDVTTAVTGPIGNGATPTWIGSNSCVSSQRMNGKVDEVTISGKSRSANWIKLAYETQKMGSSVVLRENAVPPLQLSITSPGSDTTVGLTPFPVHYTVNGTSLVRQAGLLEGLNLVVIDTVNAQGVRSADTVRITLFTPAPVVHILSPAADTLVNSPSLSVAYTVDGVRRDSTFPLVEGPNTLVVGTFNAAGRRGADTVGVIRDTQAPVVVITSPASGLVTNQTSIPIAWTIDGVTQTTQISQSLATEGADTIFRSATDAAGNTGTTSITVIRDTQAPVVTITSPADGMLTNQTELTVAWTVDGAAQTTQTSQILSIEGANVITRSATDAAGNTGNATLSVYRDTQAPVVAITSPADGFLTNRTSIPVAWTVDEVQQSAHLTETLVQEGSNQVSRSATDAAGNTGSASITVIRDTVAPLVVIHSPTDGASTTASTVPVSWTVDGVQQTVQTSENLEIGSNSLTRSALDAAGNIGNASVTIMRTEPTAAPVVVITRPTEGDITTAKAIRVEWTVDGVPQPPTDERLAEGVNAIHRFYTNAAGQTGQAKVTLVRNRFPDQLRASALASPQSGGVPLTVEFTGWGNSPAGLRYHKWDFDGDGIFDTILSVNPDTIAFGRIDFESGLQDWVPGGNSGSLALGHSGQRSGGTPVVQVWSTNAEPLYEENMAAWIASPTFAIPAGQPVTLSWSQDFSSEAGWDYGHVEIDAGSGFETLRYYDGELGTTDETLDLSAYAGQTIRIRFLFTSDYVINGAGWKVRTITAQTADGQILFSDPGAGSVAWEKNPSGTQWSLIPDPHGPVLGRGTRWIESDTSAYAYPGGLDAWITSPKIGLPPAGGMGMTFWHFLATQSGPSFQDGGFVEISVNDAPFQPIAPVGGYPAVLAGYGPAFAGSLGASDPVFDLTAHAGDSVRFRFHFVSDAVDSGRGWLIDDFRIFRISSGTGSAQTKVTHVYPVPGDFQAGYAIEDSLGATAAAPPVPLAVKAGPAGAPVVEIWNPNNGLETNQGQIPVTWAVDGIPQTTGTSEALPTDGTHLVSRSYTDPDGRTGTAGRSIIRDTQAPSIYFAYPYEGLETASRVVSVWANLENGFVSREDTLVEGVNLITVNDTDEAGNVGSASVHVTLDVQPPVVRIVSPGADTTVAFWQVAIEYTVDGQTRNELRDLVPGPNQIVVSAWDAAGNIGRDTVVVTRIDPPFVYISSPMDGEVFYGADITVQWVVDGVYMLTDTLAHLEEGPNVIERCFTNAAGLTACDSRQVRYDPNPPVVRILSPEDGTFAIRSQLTVDWAVDVVWTVDGDTMTSATRERIFSEGEHQIIRSYTDADGSTGADTITVIKDTRPPEIALIRPRQSGIVLGPEAEIRWMADSVEQTPIYFSMDSTGANYRMLRATDAAGNRDSLLAAFYSGTTVPDLIDLSHRQADSILVLSVLAPDSLWEINDSLPTGTVFAQSPAAGDSIRYHFKVKYRIAIGPDAKDLVADYVNADSVSVDPNTLAAGGFARVSVSDRGRVAAADSFSIALFEDRNLNQRYEPGVDRMLGSARSVSPIAAGDSAVFSVPVAGTLQFNGNRICAAVDYTGRIAEFREDNNFAQSMAECRKRPLAVDFTPRKLWAWADTAGGVGAGSVHSKPMVANIDDDNGDGVVNAEDIPDVIVQTHENSVCYGSVRVLSGKDGSEIWNRRVNPYGFSDFAVGDLDHDGKPEIVFLQSTQYCWDRRIVVLDNEGNEKSAGDWRYFASAGFHLEGIILSDMDGDGKSEIIWGPNIHDRDARLVYPSTFDKWLDHSIPADLDGDGYQELVGSEDSPIDLSPYLAIHSFKDKEVAKRSAFWTANPMVARLGSGPEPRIFAQRYEWDHIGMAESFDLGLTDRLDYPGTGFTDPPYDRTYPWSSYLSSSASFYGTDTSRQAYTFGGTFSCLPGSNSCDGWSYFSRTNLRDSSVAFKIHHRQSAGAGGQPFDLDGDGVPELISHSNDSLLISDADGNLLSGIQVPAHPGGNNMTIADIDRDGHADIVVSYRNTSRDLRTGAWIQGPGVVAYSNPTWVGARSIYNERYYTVTNVDDDGSIPRFPTPHWQAQNTVNIQCTAGQYACVDISASLPQITINGSGVKSLTARIGNGGAQELPDGIPVSVFADHLGTETLLAVLPSPKRLRPGEFYTLNLPIADSIRGRYEFRIAADDSGNGQGRLDESSESNNSVRLSFLLNNQSPTFTAMSNHMAVSGQEFTLSAPATDPDGDGLTYSLAKAPTGMTIGAGSGTLQWIPPVNPPRETVTVAVADPFQGTDTVTFLIYVDDGSNQPPLISSVPGTSATLNSISTTSLSVYRYAIAAEDPEGGILEYAIRCAGCGGKPGPMMAGDSLTWIPFQPPWQAGESAHLELTVTDARGATAVQDWSVALNRGQNSPPIIGSAPVVNATEDLPWRSPFLVGDLEEDPLHLVYDTLPPGMTYANDSLRWTPAIHGAFPVRIGVTDGLDTAWQRFTLTVATRNDAPILRSRPDTLAIWGAPYLYSAKATDEEGDALTYAVEGPSGMTVNSAGMVVWPVPLDEVSPAAVELIVRDGNGGEARQSWSIRLRPDCIPPSVSVSFTRNPARPGLPDTVTVAASDNVGLTGISLTLDGDVLPLNGGKHIFTPADTGLYAFTARAEDELGNSSLAVSVLRVTASDIAPPLVTLSHSPQNPAAGQIVTFTVDASDDVALDISRIWVLVDGLTLPVVNGQASFPAMRPGNVLAKAVAFDSAGNSAAATDAFFVSPLAGDATAPVAAIDSPSEDTTVFGRVEIIGTAGDENLAYYALSRRDLNDSAFTEFFRSTDEVQGARLGWLDGSTLVNGDYEIVLEVFDRAGNSSRQTTQVHVAGEGKLGAFTLAFQDLTVPMAGLDLTVTRAYDSRDKAKGDFGHGWRMGLRSIALHENRNLGTAWSIQHTFGMLWHYYFTEEKAHTVTVTLPGGRKQEFVPEPKFDNCLGNGVCPVSFTGRMIFKPRPGTYGRLDILDGDAFLVAGNELWAENFYAKDPENMHFNPQRYKLTLLDGSYFIIDQDAGGVVESGDANGNKAVWEVDAIRHSTGDALVFARDSEGRIASVSDPAGRSVHYGYDVLGNLSEAVDPEGNVTRFKYGPDHYLNEIIDARGIRAERTEYDDEGRVVRRINANGDTLRLTHDPDARTETIEDFAGNSISYSYDERGNVLTKSDDAGNTWRYAYDSTDNVTSTRLPGGATRSSTFDAKGNELTTTDELGEVTHRTYDAMGHVLTSTDPIGRVSSFDYDASGNLVKETGPDGVVQSERTYDSQGNVLTEKDALGRITTHAYDFRGRTIRTTDALGNVHRMGYDAAGNLAFEVNAAGDTTHHAYDNNGNRTATVNAAGDSIRTRYNAIGKPVLVIDALGNATRHVYDRVGDKVADSAADGSVVRRAYDAVGNLAEITDQVGRVTRMEYDFEKRLRKTLFNDGGSTENFYDALGRRIRTLDVNGNETRFGYDAAGRNTSVTDALGKVTRYEYDDAGRRTAMVDALQRRTEFEYDAYDRLTLTRLADGSEKSTAYDAAGRKLSETDQAGKTTGFEYDEVGNLTAVVDALGHRTEYAYDANNNRISQKDAKNHTTSLEYDGLNRMVRRTYPNGDQERWTFDANGNILGYVKGTASTAYAYDALNREVFRRHLPSGHEVRTAYAADGKRDSVIDHRGLTTFAYDVRGRLAAETMPNGEFIESAYDRQGNRTEMATRFGTMRYTYDVLNRMDSVVSDDELATVYRYNEVGNRDSLVNPNGTSVGYSYDALNRLTEVRNWGPTGQLSRFAYTLNPAGIRTAVEELDGSRVAYGYDDLYRLTSETRTGSHAYSIAYTYDKVGNRLTQVRNGVTTTSTYNNRDQLETETNPSGSVGYAYDEAGRLLSKTAAAGTTQYAWVDGDRLDSISGPGVGVKYSYDADGRQVKQVSGGQTKQYLVDRLLPYGQVIAETDGSNDLAAEYTYGLERISQERGGETHWYLADGQGSVRQLADSAGEVTDTWDFAAFGEELARTGSTENRFAYTGEEFDPNAQLYYLRARWMEPSTGRFVSLDPIENCPDCVTGGCAGCIQIPAPRSSCLELGCSKKQKSYLTLTVLGGKSQCFRAPQHYNYADNSPVSKIDPTGKYALSLPNVVLAFVAAAIIYETMQTISKTSPAWPTLKRVRDRSCRCTKRYIFDPDLNELCPDQVYGRGPDMGTCQRNAKLTAPEECRAFYGHCGWTF